MTLAQRVVKLPKGAYAVIDVGLDDPQVSNRHRAALAVAETAGLISLRYPHLIQEKVYEGMINTAEGIIFAREDPVTLTAWTAPDPEAIASDLKGDLCVIRGATADDRNRFQLAARWLRRGDEANNRVDKFLFWWTVLEIFPAKGKKVANETAEFLQSQLYPSVDRQEIKTKLDLGRMSGMRDTIVHEGQAFVDESESDVFRKRLEKLSAISGTCLRGLAGLQLGEDLDPFMQLTTD